jgi:hypothetical protein
MRVIARLFHELASRDRKTGNPLAGLRGAQEAIHEISGLGGFLTLFSLVGTCTFRYKAEGEKIYSDDHLCRIIPLNPTY